MHVNLCNLTKECLILRLVFIAYFSRLVNVLLYAFGVALLAHFTSFAIFVTRDQRAFLEVARPGY